MIITMNPWISIDFHKWRKPKKWIAYIPNDYKETMICWGFFTTYYERYI